MLTQQISLYHRPLIVGENFLRALDKRLSEIGEQIAIQIAKDEKLSTENFDNIRLGHEFEKSFKNLEFKRSYDSLVNPIFEVSFKDRKFSDDLSLENILEMLDYEPVNPVYISASIGNYSKYRVSIKIEFSGIHSCELKIKSHFKQITSIRDTIWNLLVKNSDSSSIFHSPVLAKILEISGFAFSSIIFGTFLSVLIGTIKLEKIGYYYLYGFIIYTVMIVWKFVFPPVEFHFAVTPKSKNRQKLFIGLLTTILIPIVLSHFIG